MTLFYPSSVWQLGSWGCLFPLRSSPVIPTAATQFSLPISLRARFVRPGKTGMRWLGCAVEGPLFSFHAKKNYCVNDVIPSYERYYKRVLAES